MSIDGGVGDCREEKDRQPPEAPELFETRAKALGGTLGVVITQTVGDSVAEGFGDCGVRGFCGVLGLTGSCGTMVRHVVSRGEYAEG